MSDFLKFPEFGLDQIDLRIEVIQGFLVRYGYLRDGFAAGRLDEQTAEALSLYKNFNLLPTGGEDFSKSVARHMSRPRCSVRDPALDGSTQSKCIWPSNKSEIVYAITALLSLGRLNPITTINDPLEEAFAAWANHTNFPIKKIRSAGPGEIPDVAVAWVAANVPGSPLLEENVACCDFPPCAGENLLRHMLFRAGDDIEWLSSAGTYYDFQAVALHEFGHLIGLDHNPSSNIMKSTFSTGPNPIRYSFVKDDTDGVDNLYGTGGKPVNLPRLKRFFRFFRRNG